MRDNGGLDSLVSSGDIMKWLDSRDLREKHDRELRWAVVKKKVSDMSSQFVYLQHPWRQGILEEEAQFGGGEIRSSLWICRV